MTTFLSTIAPIALFFVVGVGLARGGFASESHGHFLLRFLFYLAIPALVIVKVSQADLPATKGLLPLANITVCLVCMTIAWRVGRRLALPPQQFGVMVLGAMILNNAFLLPFVLAGLDDQAFTDLILFDLGNSLVVTLLAYPLACRIGGLDAGLRAGAVRAISSPLTWALLLGVALNATDTAVPGFALSFLEPLGATVAPLILIALGILFRPSIEGLSQVTTTVAIRLGGGLLVGVGVVSALGLTGDSRTVILLASAAPIGFTAMTFASIASLDTQAAVRAVSASLIVAIVAVPVVIAAVG